MENYKFHNKELGAFGEEKACEYLKGQGYGILAKNFVCDLGEIDIIVKKDDQIVFVEVKSRVSLSYGRPYESVTLFKQKQIIKSALVFIKLHDLWDNDFRFDIISLYKDFDKIKIDHIEHAFDAQEYNFSF